MKEKTQVNCGVFPQIFCMSGYLLMSLALAVSHFSVAVSVEAGRMNQMTLFHCIYQPYLS